MTLCDIAINLTDSAFDSDRQQVVADAAAQGVNYLILTGTTVEQSTQAADYAASSQRAFATAGVHPHYADEAPADFIARLRQLARRPEVLAIGECGLDFFRDLSPRAVQEQVFAAQLELAGELAMPVLLHEREAAERQHAILRQFRDRLPGAVAHCFTGDEATLKRWLELDLYIGITGWICDERRGQHLRELVQMIPDDRLLVETDAPYLIPRDLKLKSRRNEPQYLPHIVRTIAACRRQDPQTLAAMTLANSQRLFGFAG
ncbi:TatD family hydrolase [Gallaecimonas pentaromativorans]|uniref:Sec-independent protein translocase TatD n=1 Tax=Gallaecimonas pentaromativorans TaxID=584787 RepID=A0A3N1P777_9GAMM|nr:TatD family hydrolase [Gallaecimonas pentaromativorans]MED5526235.1 TatD family hydrolase [Pseudomonadota bacterium]ROQ24373.1 Sec-independent protein translocase TatD [Gallaecimonas pentaromativorans]